MSSTAILFGLLLTILGVGGYIISGAVSPTAMIPAFFGIILLVLGFLARAEQMRKHAMHAAAAVSLIGFAGAIFSMLRAPFATRPWLANVSQVTMALLTGVFVVLCVRSFRAARRARSA